MSITIPTHILPIHLAALKPSDISSESNLLSEMISKPHVNEKYYEEEENGF